LLALTDASILDAAPQLNISIQAFPDENKLVIADSGIGMTRDELAKNLGTIARSGTSEFLSKIENASSDNKGSNLIGQFGLGELRAAREVRPDLPPGFYSSFLVAHRVSVASKSVNDADQWVFESDANADEFKIKKDPRGVTLGRGTEITLWVDLLATQQLLTDFAAI
jgi:heat shock protein beta